MHLWIRLWIFHNKVGSARTTILIKLFLILISEILAVIIKRTLAIKYWRILLQLVETYQEWTFKAQNRVQKRISNVAMKCNHSQAIPTQIGKKLTRLICSQMKSDFNKNLIHGVILKTQFRTFKMAGRERKENQYQAAMTHIFQIFHSK